MKHFDKWRDSNCAEHCNLCFIGVCGDCTGIGTKEDVWKAALEWALSQETVKPLLGHNEHRYVDSIAIRNELNND